MMVDNDKQVRVSKNQIRLPDGEIVKLPKKYTHKRKVEKYISKRIKEISKTVTTKKQKKKKTEELLIPIIIDHKTVIYVRESNCFEERWLLYIPRELMEKRIAFFKQRNENAGEDI